MQLSNSQINKLSDICSNIGMVSLASIALPTIFTQTNALLTCSGLIMTILFWLFSILLLK